MKFLIVLCRAVVEVLERVRCRDRRSSRSDLRVMLNFHYLSDNSHSLHVIKHPRFSHLGLRLDYLKVHQQTLLRQRRPHGELPVKVVVGPQDDTNAISRHRGIGHGVES